MNYSSRKVYGDKWQNTFTKLMISAGAVSEKITRCDDFRFDLDIDGTTYELKRDSRTKVTHNICIKFRYGGKESGILTSTADYWSIYIDETNYYYLVPRTILHEICTSESHKTVHTHDGGDCYLIPESRLQRYMQFIDASLLRHKT